MKKNISLLLLHGWGGDGNAEFFSQIKERFTSQIEIISPSMPNPTRPAPESWTLAVEKAIAGKNIKICIAHSLGGTLAMRMIASGLIAPEYLFTIGSSHGPKDDDDMDMFLVPPLKMTPLKNLRKFYAIASYDDPATCSEYTTLLVKQANAVGLFYKDKGHFIQGTQLPEEVMILIANAIERLNFS